MSSTVRLSLTASVRDYAVKAQSCGDSYEDATATTHDLVNTTHLTSVSTAGGIGSTFQPVPSSVNGIERVFGVLGPGANVWFRFGGLVATVLGLGGTYVMADGATLALSVDGGTLTTVTFEDTDTTPLLAAKRINYALGLPVASVNTGDGKLRLDGLRTGSSGARDEGRGYGGITIASGSALGTLGLSVGSTYGAGIDLPVGGGAFAFAFPSGTKPGRLELSGSASSARITVAGSAT